MIKKITAIVILFLLSSCSTPSEKTVVVYDEQDLAEVSPIQNISPVATNKTENIAKPAVTSIKFNIFNDNKKDLEKYLKKPMGIAFDNEGNFYLLDQDKNKLYKFSNNGNLISDFGSVGSAPGEFKEPKYITTSKDNNVIITDTWNQRIQILDKKGDAVDLISLDFFGPKGIIFKNDLFYVADTGHHVVKIIDKDRKVKTTIGANKDVNINLHEPTGLTIDDNNNLYIIDSMNNRIVKITKDNKFVKEWNIEEWKEDKSGKESFIAYHNNKLYLTDPLKGNVIVFDTQGNRIKELFTDLKAPSGIAIYKNKAYVVEAGRLKVNVIDLNKG
ncbi:MAG: NHL repeat-containing protein [Cyanobacteriota bacterium]